jgi:hypothetical protein
MMIESAKGIEIGRNFNYYMYQCVGFQHVFGPLNYKFWLTKVVPLYDVKCIDRFYGGYNVKLNGSFHWFSNMSKKNVNYIKFP